MIEIIDKIEYRLTEVDKALSDPENMTDRKKLIELNRERSHIESILTAGKLYRNLKNDVDEAHEIIREGSDPELVEMAREELEQQEADLEKAELEFKLKLLPRDPTDDKAAVVEIRAGTGGEEAGLFAGDIFKMYQRYADKQSKPNQKLRSLTNYDCIN